MQLSTAQGAVAIGAKIDVCNAILAQIQSAGTNGAVITRADVACPDGSNGAVFMFPNELEITPTETNTIGQALATILTARIATYTAQLAAL